MRKLVHVKNIVHQQLLIEVKVNIIFGAHSEILQRFLLVANQLSDKVFGNLYPLNFELIQSFLNPMF